MELNEYIKLALRTESIIDNITIDKNEINYILNIFIITTELLDSIKKKYYYHNSKKYDNEFNDLVKKLDYFIQGLNRHHSDKEEILLDINPRVFHGLIGILTESGELAQQLEKGINTGIVDPINIQEELGDGAGGSNSWYAAILHDALNLDPYETMRKNIDKLALRYGDKFSDYNANNRNLDEERKILEN